MSTLSYSTVVVTVLDRAEDKIQEMRSHQDRRTVPIGLLDYTWKSFRKIDQGKEELENAALLAVDLLYQQMSFMPLIDQYTRDYFTTTVSFLFESIQSRGVDIFYVLDNEMPDDRYAGVMELFSLCKMAVISPNKENSSYEDIEKAVIESMRETKNIVYIEKDASVNYIEKVLALSKKAKEIAPDSNYVAALRNTAPSEGSNATIIARPPRK